MNTYASFLCQAEALKKQKTKTVTVFKEKSELAGMFFET